MLKGHVLIIDDDGLQLQVSRLDLEAQGYRVDTAGSTQEGLDVARAYGPDIIVLDVMMPGSSGFECLRELKADPLLCAIPVVMLTAADTLDDQLEGMASGADRYLVKPVPAELLVATLADTLSAHKTGNG